MGDYARMSIDCGENYDIILRSKRGLQELLDELKKRPCGMDGICVETAPYSLREHPFDPPPPREQLMDEDDY